MKGEEERESRAKIEIQSRVKSPPARGRLQPGVRWARVPCQSLEFAFSLATRKS